MDRESEQHKRESWLTVLFDNYLMGNSSLYKCGYCVPLPDESLTLPVGIKMKNTTA